MKARVDAVWENMNKGVPLKAIKAFPSKADSTVNKVSQQRTSHLISFSPCIDDILQSWMGVLGLKRKNKSDVQESVAKPSPIKNGTSDEAKRLAAAALAAARDAVAAATAAGSGKVEVTEVRDFAGEDIQVKKLVDADSKEASEMARASAGPTSAVDAFLEQIKKKQKLSVLDKTKKDWGEFKEENKWLEEELDAYKKSSNQYLEKVSFLQRADYREFERERDARLALQARRKSDMREEP
ncbi:BCNT-C domain [Dillenia turbinata]|uniref:BCNT-C domain n=1 Tax=Dillenia turbinata TaxID=194707 RepID=A0AAN8UB09_9MAGN